MTSHNPFRRVAQTPAPTGDTTQSLPSYYEPPPGNPPAGPHEAWRDVALPPSPTQELPPPYSATPDFNHGEQTVELGPSRPFQRQPAQPQQQPHGQAISPNSTGHRPPVNPGAAYGWSAGFTPQPPRPQSTGHRSSASHPGADYGWPAGQPTRDRVPENHSPQQSGLPGAAFGWGPGFEPGSRPPVINISSSSGSGFTPQRTGSLQRDPPPRHPSVNERPPSSNQNSSTSGNLSEFAREFYAAGENHNVEDHDLPAIPGSYAPPPGPPPARRPTRSTGSSPTSPPNPIVENDGKPTTSPVPGHPLLNRNRVLVYPRGHECQKCKHFTVYTIDC